MQNLSLAERHQQTARITILGAAFNILLAIIKCVAGWFGNSHALLADGVHSLADLFADAAVYFASKFGNQEADLDHPYGHHRIETAGTIVVAAFLLFAGLGIVVSGLQHIWHPGHDNYIHTYVLWIALLALIINEAIYWLTLHVAKKINSDMLRAHAWHRRSDAATSLIVLIGIVGSMVGLPYLDGAAAIIVGLFILKMAWDMGRRSVDELVDRGLNPKELAAIAKVIREVPGVESLHQLRTRLMGGQIYADAHIIVDPYLSVSEGHFIGDNVLVALKKYFPKVHDITIHVDSENDEITHEEYRHASRAEILQALAELTHDLPHATQAQLKAIHYFESYLLIELLLPVLCLVNNQKEQIHKPYQQKIAERIPNSRVVIFFY